MVTLGNQPELFSDSN